MGTVENGIGEIGLAFRHGCRRGGAGSLAQYKDVHGTGEEASENTLQSSSSLAAVELVARYS